MASDKHLRLQMMTLIKKSQGSAVVEFALIAKILSTLDEDAERNLKQKFEIVYMYFLCRQNLFFTKMAPLCMLKAWL